MMQPFTTLNGYELMAAWFAYADENPEWVDTNTFALYGAIVQRSNELKWKPKFQLPALHTMQRIGIRSPKTYYLALAKLEAAGFVTVLERAKNQFTACIIQLNAPVKNAVAPTPAPTEACPEHLPRHLSGTISGTGNKDKQTNTTNKTNNQTREGSLNQPTKVAYRERVQLLPTEYDTLVGKHGQGLTDQMLDKLDSYKLANGKTYKSDYGAITQWVITAVFEDRQRLNKNGKSTNPRLSVQPVANPVTFADFRDPQREEAARNGTLTQQLLQAKADHERRNAPTF